MAAPTPGAARVRRNHARGRGFVEVLVGRAFLHTTQGPLIAPRDDSSASGPAERLEQPAPPNTVGCRVNDALLRASLFRGVERLDVEALAGRLLTTEFPRGYPIYTEGLPADRVFIVVSGKVKIGRRTPDGRENLFSVMGTSDMFGELEMFDPGQRTSKATAVTAVVAVSIDRETVMTWIADHPEIADRLMRNLARWLRCANDNISDLIFNDVPGRVAKQLLQLAHKFGTQEADTLKVAHDLTQVELAQLVGASRETVNKVLTAFAQRGWIQLGNKAVWILDSVRLVERSR